MKRAEKAKLESKATDIQFMKNPMEWPRWPVLPLVKRGERLSCGFLLAEGDGSVQIFKVYLGYMYELSKKKVSEFEFKTYESAEAVSEDGWVVD